MQPGFITKLFSAGLITMAASQGYGQEYPNKPIRIIASGAGGGGDFTARVIAQGITASLGQQLIVDNRANAVVQGESLAKAPPDGYTISVSGGNVWITPLLQKTPYDPLKDLAPVTWAERSPYLLVVHPSLPVKSGKVKALAVTSAEPSALAPGMPTVAATGLPGYESIGITAVFAPAKTPAAIINRLNQDMVRYLKTPEAKEKFLSVGVETVGSTPAELFAAIEADMIRNGKVIKERNLRLD